MSLDALLVELARRGVQLKLAADDGLSVSAPRGGVSDPLRQRIGSHKAALVQWLSRRQASEREALPTIVPDPARWHDPFPLADLQAGFIVGQGEDMEFHVRAHQYIEQEYEELDVERFEVAFNAALHRQRHNLPLLTAGGELQVPRHFEPLHIRVYDLRHLPVDEAQAAMHGTRAEMSRQTLPLDRWPSEDLRASLYDGKRVRLHINHNNFFGDGYGTGKLFAAAMAYYEHPRTLPELTLGFRDCVLALAELEASPLGQASRAYWESRVPTLPGPPPVPRIAGVNTRVRSRLTLRKMRLPKDLWTQFKRRATRAGITPSNALTAVYAEVIAQWSGSRHFVLNNMVTRRFPMHPELMEVFGNFASLYPLEIDWREAASFSTRCEQLQTRLLSDSRHFHWGGMKVLQSLNQGNKTLGRAPCPFVVASGLFIEGWQEFHYSCLETPQTLLDYQFYEVTDGSLLVTWDVIEAFFPAGLIDGMQAGFELLLRRLAEDEHAWAATHFELLPADQREQRLQINRTECALPTGLLHDGLAASAARHPHKPAVIAADRTLSYAELNAAATRLTHALLEAGVEPGRLVAILHDKGWEQVVAAFGILSAGAAYVPMDPSWPQERVHHLLDSTRADIVVTSRKQQLPELPSRVRVITVDDADLAAFPDTPLPPTQCPDDLAYVIFTSGSTGLPKGVMIDHRGALNTVVDINKRFGVGEHDVLFGISSLHFDLSVFDLFGAAAAGATLVLPPAADDPDPKAWLAAVVRHGVTVWNSVPALAQLLVDAATASNAALTSLSAVMMSGDWIPVPLPAQIRSVAPAACVASLGGATEASIWSIHYPIKQVDPSWPSIPYGKPLANQTWHVLAESGGDAPVWVTGHLHIGGLGLALGYWDDAQRTDAAFVRHPRTGERLYKTGDLGRYLPDGNIEFLGRADFQVKIQGYRVELGEIETVLAQHADVSAAVVIASGAQAGKQLIAFVVARPGTAVDTQALLAHLRSKLPHYMVPSHIVPIEQVPLSATGKVDRRALTRLGPSDDMRREFMAPRNETERALVGIWEDVLSVSPIGVHDDFFDLGGQSFAAVRMMTRIAQQFGQELPIGVLIERRTVEALACRVQDQSAWSPLVQLRAQGEGAPCFFVHPAGGSVMCYRGLAERLGRPFHGLQARGLSGEAPPLESVEQMAALYLDAIRSVRPHGPYLLGGWSSGGMIAFEIARQLEALGEEVERIVMIDAPAPMQDRAVDDVTLLMWFLEDLDIGIDAARLNRHDLQGEPVQVLSAALASTDESSGMREIDPRQLERVLAVFTRIVRAGRRYRPASIRADISVLRASEGCVSEFADHPAASGDDWGWRRFTSGCVHGAAVAGTHHTVLHARNVDGLAERLLEQLSPPEPVRLRAGAM